MAEPVTLESLSRQLNLILAELDAARDELGEMRRAVLRCVETVQRIERTLEEMSSLLASYEID